MLANGDTIDELLEEYPSLERNDILACLDYAASLAEEQVTPIEALVGALTWTFRIGTKHRDLCNRCFV
ncbi:TPA: DUF433 domain-containing protein [Candidatus Poribacteria bacterium]|nr:DUF433 domain-containing protein [Candidatus Poribacteria bacterium]